MLGHIVLPRLLLPEGLLHAPLSTSARPILSAVSVDLKLVPSITAYTRWGKGPKQRHRFTKTADPKLEEAYARHLSKRSEFVFEAYVNDRMEVIFLAGLPDVAESRQDSRVNN